MGYTYAKKTRFSLKFQSNWVSCVFGCDNIQSFATTCGKRGTPISQMMQDQRWEELKRLAQAWKRQTCPALLGPGPLGSSPSMCAPGAQKMGSFRVSCSFHQLNSSPLGPKEVGSVGVFSFRTGSHFLPSPPQTPGMPWHIGGQRGCCLCTHPGLSSQSPSCRGNRTQFKAGWCQATLQETNKCKWKRGKNRPIT